ncbi:hypothetical protein CAI21_11060 [Alkalilimnicola ehrlichii]|uniref:DUF4139 domain-containing protein n=1 Tax=Alkalilimnicola ehrlichii TaxID=351052 RepID=UPI000E2FB42E|nr:DUF4139 domain-containing protein [Alkalilimnicola ehrlichii]RFA28984.1 hypothetical protein CAI21_11060 [Alkalilimnicola ehrlichii]
MRRTRWGIGAIGVVMLVSGLATAADIESTAVDRVDLDLTLYSNGLSLVREGRTVELAPGEQVLAVGDVSRELVADSIRADGPFVLREQRFAYDAGTPERLLERYVGRPITLIQHHTETGRTTEVEAQLLALSNGTPIYRIGDSIEIGDDHSPWRPRLPIEKNTFVTPTVLLGLISETRGPQALELSYLTGGLGWEASYNARLHPDRGRLDLDAWASLHNRSGVDFENATIALIAGEPYQAARPMPAMRAETMRAHSAEAEFHVSGSSYRRYDLPEPISLADGERKQVRLFANDGVPVQLEYRLIGEGSRSQRTEVRQNAELWLHLDNSSPNLGRALPAGIARIYEAIETNGEQLLGEVHIPALAPEPMGKPGRSKLRCSWRAATNRLSGPGRRGSRI